MEKSIKQVLASYVLYDDAPKKEKELIFNVILDSDFNKSEAANTIGITENELEQRINILGIGQEISARELWANTESDYLRQIDLISLDEFLDIVEIKLTKDFLTVRQRIGFEGYHDVEDFYK